MKKYVSAFALLIVVALGEDVSVSLLAREFRKGVLDIDGPEAIAAHVSTNDFANKFMYIAGEFYTDIMVEYLRQARLVSTVVGNDFVGSVDILLSRATGETVNNSTDLGDILNDINRRLHNLLIMKPGIFNGQDEVELSELPAQTGPILIHYENYEPERLFNDLENLIDHDMASLYHFTQKIYLHGWQKARQSVKKLQQQFRDQFLHCILLTTFLEQTSKINANNEFLEKHVEAQLWNKYKELSDRLILIGQNLGSTTKSCNVNVLSA